MRARLLSVVGFVLLALGVLGGVSLAAPRATSPRERPSPDILTEDAVRPPFNLVTTTPTPTPLTTATAEIPAPVVEEFRVEPTIINPGDPVTITWRVRDAQVVMIEGLSTEQLSPTGQLTHRPERTTTYVLTASNQGRPAEPRAQEVVVRPLAGTLVPPTQPPPTPVPPTAAPPPPAGSATATAVTGPTPTPPPRLVIEAEWPRRLEASATDSLRVTLVSRAGGLVAATVEVSGHVARVATPAGVGTPDVPVAAAFGGQHQVFVVGRVAAPGFDVSPSEPQRRALDEPGDGLTYIWAIKPKGPGRQIVVLSVDLEWVAAGTASIQRPVWTVPAHVEVYKPLFTRGEISVMSLVAGAVGSGLNIPFLQGLLKGRMGKKPARASPRRRKQDG